MAVESTPSPPARPSFLERLCRRDNRRFIKYVESTTTHGLVRIFTGKSRLRRFFWLFVFLAAAAACLNNIIERGRHLASRPTATTISQIGQQSLVFPAVTICNLNIVRRSEVARFGEESLQAVEQLASNRFVVCDGTAFNSGSTIFDSEDDINLREVQFQGRHLLEDMLDECVFSGAECTSDDFQLVLTKLGYCYTFNSGYNNSMVRSTLGTGTRHGLSLVLNISQDEYLLTAGDAGVKIAVHGQGEPAEPDELGLGVPPGTNAFISLRKRDVQDESGSRHERCREVEDIGGFNFLHELFNYSTSACLIDCFYTNITEECGCIEANVEYPPLSSEFSSIRNCSASDICCVLDLYDRPQVCDCPVACAYISYEPRVSYSGFPAKLVSQRLAQETGLPEDDFRDNLLAVNIYFETLNVELEITKDSYSVIAFLSDMGGQLGLFVGASVISVLEFATWVLDECKDRCIGVSDKKLKKWSEELEQELADMDKPKDEKESHDKQSKSHDTT